MTPQQARDAAAGLYPPRQRERHLGLEHDHDLRLVQIDYEEGLQTREYVCRECGGTWYE